MALLPIDPRRPVPLPAAPVRAWQPAPRPVRVPLSVIHPAAAATTQKKPHKQSILGQLGHFFTDLPAGIVHVGKDIGVSMAAPVRALVDAIHGEISPLQAAGVASTAFGGTGGAAIASSDNIRKYLPLQTQLGESGQRTVGDIRHPTHFVQAYQRGEIVGKIIEDATNLSMAGGLASKAFGSAAEAATASGRVGLAGGLERGAQIAERIKQGAEFPVQLPSQIVKLGKAGAVKAFDALGETERYGERVANTRAKFALQLTEEGKVGKEALVEGRRAANRGVTRVQRDLGVGGGLLEKDLADRPSLAEQGAATALLNGIGKGDQLIIERAKAQGLPLSPEDVRQLHVLRDIPEQTYTGAVGRTGEPTPDVAGTTRAYLEGTLDPASKARVDRVIESNRAQVGKVTATALEGTGRIKGSLNPQQLGDEALDTHVDIALEDAGVSRAIRDKLQNARRTGATWEQLATIMPELDQILNAPEVYPKAWRPTLRAMGLAKAGGVDVPVRPLQLRDLGMDTPQYFPGGESAALYPKRFGMAREATREGTVGLRGVSSEHFSAVNETGPYSINTLADKLSSEVSRTAFNDAVAGFAQHAAIPRVDLVLDRGTLSKLKAGADAAAEAMGGNQQQIASRARELYGVEVIRELRNKGYEVFHGDPTDPQMGDFNPDAQIHPKNVTDQAMVLPVGVKAKLIPYWTERGGNALMQAVHWTNTKFKGAVLPFSIRWQLGDMVGGAFMSWVGGGIDPITLSKSMIDARKLGPLAKEQMFEHPQFSEANLNFDERQAIHGGTGPDAGRQPRTPIGKIQRASFKFNQTINRVNRQGYLLAKLDQVLGREGLSSVAGLGEDAAKWAEPKVQAALNEAVHDASKVMGTFDEMSPFEQRYMREIFPFYAWTRHITGLAWRTAADNPARMLWTLRLGSMGTDPNADLPPWLAGSIGIGSSSLLPLQGLNPFNDVGGGDPAFTPVGALKASSPLIKWGGAALLGADLNRGGLQLSRPFGTGDTDSLGRSGNTPLWRRPAELAFQVANTFPLTRTALNVAPTGILGKGPGFIQKIEDKTGLSSIGTGPNARYGSGRMMVDKNGRPLFPAEPILGSRRLRPLAGIVGLPVPTDKSEAVKQQTAATKRRALTKAKRKKVKLG